MKSLIFTLGCLLSCAKSKNDRQDLSPVVVPEEEVGGDSPPAHEEEPRHG